jgi:predicted PurR-regulated permease PerM
MIILYLLYFLHQITLISGINLIETLENNILQYKILRFNNTNINSVVESSSPVLIINNTNITNDKAIDNTSTIIYSVLGGVVGCLLISITIYYKLKKIKKIKRLKNIEKNKEEENKNKIAKIIESTPDNEIVVLDI